MRLSKSGTTLRMCSRTPSTSALVSLCSVWSSLTPTLNISLAGSWYYSLSTKPSMISINVPFGKIDLASHILWMCPHTWQDQFNLHEKGMTPVDMCLLLQSLEAIERIWTQERSNTQSKKKASHNGKKGNKRPGTKSTSRVPKKACTEMRPLQEVWGHIYHTHLQGLS